MRDPSVLTVLADVPRDQWSALRAHLKTKVNPDAAGVFSAIDFEAYPNLHFLSFFMPRAMKDDPPSDGPAEDAVRGHLVMEATFDGPEDAFIRDLVARDLPALIDIFGKCAGFPKMAVENPHLVEIFLTQHSLPSPTFFSGAPGKSVTEIKREHRLRRRLGEILRDTPPDVLAGEPRRLQDHLRREALKDPELRTMAHPPRPTRSLTDSAFMMRLAGFVLTLPVFLIGALLFCIEPVAATWAALVSPDLAGAACALLIAAAALLPLRVAQDAAQAMAGAVDPRSWPFVINGLAGGASLIVKITAAIIAIWAVFLLAQPVKDWVWPVYSLWLDHLHYLIAAPLYGLLVIALSGVILVVFAIVYGLALFWGAARASAGRLQPKDHTQPKFSVKTVLRSIGAWAFFVAFWTPFALSLIPLAVFLIAVFGSITADPAPYLWIIVVQLGGWFAVGLPVILTVWVILLMAHDLLQKVENRNLANPLDLYNRPPEAMHRWADEEHGYNRRQNHYISLTNVKKCRVRYWLLILALTIVNFLARYKDNAGTLGGIPTIFSARWAFIDDGRRLLFMTNYSGAWDSYLNEFSELASVFGVNLIWTNTYIASKNPRYAPGIRFPETELFTGRGARKTLPFKAYVRRSQLETLVWYGAYRDLSVVNVSENARIREAVFGPTDAAALDFLLKRL